MIFLHLPLCRSPSITPLLVNPPPSHRPLPEQQSSRLILFIAPSSGIRTIRAWSASAATGEMLLWEQQRHPGLEGGRAPRQPHRGLHSGAG